MEEAKEVYFLRNLKIHRTEGGFLHCYVFAANEQFLFSSRQIKLYNEVLPHL
jgi:hypothetical protein